MAVRTHRSTVVSIRSRPSGLKARLYRAAMSPAAKITYVTIGAMGVAALAVAIFGPGPFQRGIIRPARDAITDQTEKLWSEARPLRDQLSGLISRAASESVREKLIQSWIGHFRAT